MQVLFCLRHPYIGPKGDEPDMHTSKSWHGKKGSGGGKRHNLIVGLLTAIGIFAVSVTVVALQVSRGNMQMEKSGLIGKLLYGSAIFAGCFLTARRSAQAKLLWASITGLTVCVLFLGVAYAVPGVNWISLGGLLGITGVAMLLGGVAGSRKKRTSYG